MPASLNPLWQFLQPLTLRVVRLVAGPAVGYMTREAIADSLGECRDGKLVELLPDLVVRRILETGHKGYHLAIPDTAVPDQYRAALLAWLESEEKRIGHIPG